MNNTIKTSIISWICENPRYCATLSLLFIISCWSGLPNLGFSGDYRNLFDSQDPYLKKLDQINDDFIQNSFIIFVIRDSEATIFNEENFSIIEDITNNSWEIPHSIKVDSITNFQRIYSHDDTFFVEPLRDVSHHGFNDFSKIKDIATSEKSITDRIISKDGKTTAVVISIILPDKDRQEALSDSVNFAREIQNSFHKTHPNLDIYLTGEVVMDQVLLEVVMSDMSSIMSLMLLVGFFILWFLLRSLFSVICTWLIIILSLSCAMGIGGWGGYVINNISSASPMTIMIIAIADAIHILTPFLIYLRQGFDKKSALQKSLNINFIPITVTSLTTAIGFLGLNFASASAFRDFGNIVAFGVLTAYIFSLLLLPAIILLLPIKSQHRPFSITSLSGKIARFSVRYSKVNLIWPILLTIVCVFQLPKIIFDDDLAKNLAPSVPLHNAILQADKHLVGYQNIFYSLDSKTPEGVNDPQFLAKVEEFIEWYRAQPNVTNVSSYIDTVKQINKVLHQDNNDWYKIPDNKSLASQYMLLYEMSLPTGKDLTSDINIERSALRIAITLKQITNNDLISLEQRGNQWLKNHAPELETVGTSQSLLLAYLNKKMLSDMTTGSISVMLCITIIIVIGLRSLRFGLISIIPNLLPAIIVYGIWAMTIQQVNAAAALTFSVSLGLVVDDTIHFLSKYLEARRQNLSAEEAIYYAFENCGTALFVTTLALGSGIALLAFSQFVPNATSAMLLSPIIFTALLIDFLFLPALLLAIEKITPFQHTPASKL